MPRLVEKVTRPGIGAGDLDEAVFKAVDGRQPAVERQGLGDRVGGGRRPAARGRSKAAPALGAPAGAAPG